MHTFDITVIVTAFKLYKWFFIDNQAEIDKDIKNSQFKEAELKKLKEDEIQRK